jgi:hypothetical protein
MAQLKSTAVNGNLAVTGAIYADKIAKIGGTDQQVLLANGGVKNISELGGGAGTVTKVEMSVPTGLSVTPTSITSSGKFAITYASGYSIPTTTKQGNWDTAYGWGNHANGGYAKLVLDNNFTGA